MSDELNLMARERLAERALIAEEKMERFRSALDAIVGGWDGHPWIGVYRAAGGGYGGLQAIARAALEPYPPPTEER